MEDIHVVAAIHTLALHSGEHGRTQKAGYGRTTAISCKNWKNRITQLTRTESIQIDPYNAANGECFRRIARLAEGIKPRFRRATPQR